VLRAGCLCFSYISYDTSLAGGLVAVYAHTKVIQHHFTYYLSACQVCARFLVRLEILLQLWQDSTLAQFCLQFCLGKNTKLGGQFCLQFCKTKLKTKITVLFLFLLTDRIKSLKNKTKLQFCLQFCFVRIALNKKKDFADKVKTLSLKFQLYN
jgi:hypothetical protein